MSSGGRAGEFIDRTGGVTWGSIANEEEEDLSRLPTFKNAAPEDSAWVNGCEGPSRGVEMRESSNNPEGRVFMPFERGFMGGDRKAFKPGLAKDDGGLRSVSIKLSLRLWDEALRFSGFSLTLSLPTELWSAGEKPGETGPKVGVRMLLPSFELAMPLLG